MSSVAEVIDAVKHFTEEEKDEFFVRSQETTFQDAWDWQMEANAKAGRLDFLSQEADEATRSGTLRHGRGWSREIAGHSAVLKR